jgi:hypothetical protein
MALLSFADSHPEPSGSRWATPPSLIQQRPGHSRRNAISRLRLKPTAGSQGDDVQFSSGIVGLEKARRKRGLDGGVNSWNAADSEIGNLAHTVDAPNGQPSKCGIGTYFTR